MFLTPKVFNFNVYQSLQWPIHQPLHEYHSTHRSNGRHLPTVHFSKIGALNNSVRTLNPPTINRLHANNLLFQSLTPTAGNSVQQQKRSNSKQHKYGLDILNNKPRSIIIIKHGNEKPHRTITILLNRRTTQTFDQLLSDISESFGYQKNQSNRIKRLSTLKGRHVNGINDFFRDDDIFIASTHTNDIPSNELQEIILELSSDSQNLMTARRNQLKQTTPVIDRNTPHPQIITPGAISVDVKKTSTIRDSGFLDDEDGLSGRNSETTSPRVTHHNKPNEINNEDLSLSNDFNSRKLKSKKKIVETTKLNSITNIEQQRERERQRLRDEDERRKKLIIRKDYCQPMQITSVPKFEQLTIDENNDDSSNLNKKKIFNKPLLNINENQITTTPTIKKRSVVVHSTPSVVTDQYELGKKMGDGNFAIVRRSKLRQIEKEVAIKIIDKSKMKGKEYMLDHEINIMYECNHPNIVRLFQDYQTVDEIYLVMELIKGGDLFDYIVKHRHFDEPTSSSMIKDISEALLYLHAKSIVHRDVKPENLLVMHKKDGRITIKLTDFGLALHVKEPIKTVCGTPTYVAPEILEETGYGIEVDCWATGIILYILLCGYPPFKTTDRSQEELFQSIKHGKFHYDPDYWSFISSNAKDLIDHLIVVDRHKRLRADEILLHPWIITNGQLKSTNNLEELKINLRRKYATKIKEYAMENILS